MTKQQRQPAKRFTHNRQSASRRGYDRRWQNARKFFLKNNPLCVVCKANGILTEATVVDHIKPHNGDKNLFWNEKNWQPLCASCHSKKTNRQDGGFGNRPASVKVTQYPRGNVWLGDGTPGGRSESLEAVNCRPGASLYVGFRELNTGGRNETRD